MTETSFSTLATTALVSVLTLSPPAFAQDGHRDALPEPAPAVVLAEPAAPRIVGGKVYWSDHRLTALCHLFGGEFAKLAGSAVYVCAPRDAGEAAPQAKAGGDVAGR